MCIFVVEMTINMCVLQDDPERSLITPVCLPWGPNDPGHHLHESDKLVVTGWGKVTNDAVESRRRYTQYGVPSRTLQVSIPATNSCANEKARPFHIQTQKPSIFLIWSQ